MSIKNEELLILIDGSSYLYRAFHALPPLVNSHREPTGAVYGVINMLRKTLDNYKPAYVGVVFDAKGKNFRHELYPEYKANRPPMEEDLKVQIEPLHQIIKAMGLPLLVVDGVEADDVIGTLAKAAEKKGIKTLISTSDKDMAQLVDSSITLINTMNNTSMDINGVKDKFGVTPEQFVDYLTLVGDSSDNIPGVNGVGPKTAVKWLNEYGSLQGVLDHRDQIKGKIGEKLKASMGHLSLSKELVTIKDDVDLKMDPIDLVVDKNDLQKLKELFIRLEFRRWLKELGLDVVENDSVQDKIKSKYHTILTKKEFEVWLEKLKKADSFAFDTETTSLDVIDAELVGISFAVELDEAAYIPLAHNYDSAPTQLDLTLVLEKLTPVFIDAKKIKLGQNLKYDIGVLANYGIEVEGLGFDTMLESYILNSSSNQHNKESLVLKYLGETITTYEDLVGKGAKQIPFSKVDLKKATPYAAYDSNLVLKLHQVMWPQIEKNQNEQKVFTEIEMPLLKVLSKMERRGVAIDKKFLENYSSDLAKRLTKLEQKIYQEVGNEFNINSPSQLQEILYKKLGLPVLQKTSTGKPSTAEPVLQELALDYDFPKLILEYRSLSKLKSTYTDALPKEINVKTGRVHTSYNQAVTITGRLSSTNPNLQNIPIRTEEGRKIREAFIASVGFKIVSADYSQIELRIMAHLSEDENLCQAFAKGEDVHRMVAAEIFEVKPEEVTLNQRRDAKTINFGLIYGMSAFGLAKRIGMSRGEAQKYIDIYFARYPRMKEYMEKMRDLARKQGFVESAFGRRLYLPDIKSKNFNIRAAAERTAINAPIQGTAADIIKMAMINIESWLDEVDFAASMIMQVHDELVFEVSEKYVETLQNKVKHLMERVVILKVPLIVDVGIGNNWGESH